jgi:hypothetical protein
MASAWQSRTMTAPCTGTCCASCAKRPPFHHRCCVKFAIREDREELGTNTGPRFKSELINPRKGTPTSYIAKYISKNIDGRGLAKEISKETGRSLRDSAEHVSAWASLHRVQQFRFFGIPGRQAYRELRLLAGQAASAGRTQSRCAGTG